MTALNVAKFGRMAFSSMYVSVSCSENDSTFTAKTHMMFAHVQCSSGGVGGDDTVTVVIITRFYL